MFGQTRFAATNALLNDRFARFGTLIAAHRGTGIASVVENTADAAAAALASGADVVEIDVIASRDGQFFAFHDGEERRLLGVDQDLRLMTADQIDELRYTFVDRPSRPARVERVLELLDAFRGKGLFHLDRSWWWWRRLLPALDALGMTGQLLLKCPAEDGWADALRAHPVKYPFMPICRTVAEAERYLGDESLNTVGVELLATTANSPFLRADTIARLHAHGVFVLVNAEVLADGPDLFAGYDDEVAVLRSPEEGWGPLFDLGVDVIQTDWPWLLRDYRRRRNRRLRAEGEEVSR
ncbi:glycerophosphodiester phosphodiesterase family protein [Thermostaphylospora chromogena]|uniref:Glycerophosphoryl diester phosphodiesterase n=1 Tax=Thermostaphylospora chromogena TaxID=35622 RepID=A0A1H1F6G9_9ACTN|nr:glycerophosphodiester phosphodiesterase family protein [Thermostaphylospora chromogena]SDQ96344.1 glycerophosphoryl diester phosphodiesterase [Thermostaphylospora chromogena]